MPTIRSPRFRLYRFAMIALLATIPWPAWSGDEGQITLPSFEFSPDMPWLNVSKPIRLSELKGKVVVLDFWTYGCINCVHVLEDLKTLETKYHPYLAVIGVHTPKFDREKELKALRNIVVRYGIEHPVVNDVEFRAGRYYGMRAWPTQVVIDPQGIPLGKVIGEGNLDILDSAIAKLIEEQKDRLDPTPLPISLESEKLERSPLAAPEKSPSLDATWQSAIRCITASFWPTAPARFSRSLGGQSPATRTETRSMRDSHPPKEL